VRFLVIAFLLAGAAPLGGCVNTDTSVFVTPTITSPSAKVQMGALGATVTGAFDLDLHLGARASGPSTVTLGEFNILDAEQHGSILPAPLSVTGSLTSPIVVQPNSDEDDDFTFDTGNGTEPTSVVTALCAPAGVVISGVFQDSLTGMSTPVSSSVFQVSGCM
jgi:hypothetical protein